MDVNATEDNSSALPNAAATDASDCVERPFPASAPARRDGEFAVVVAQSAFNRLYDHAHAATDVEICGVLLGNVCHDGGAPFLHITASIEGLHADNHAARVTFTSDTWTHFHEVLERDFPGQRIVGWYHTHPGFGIFLSGMDLFIHGNFFSLPWQVAYVYDPLNGEEGFFVWRDGKARRMDAVVEPDVASRKPAIEQKVKRSPPQDEVDPEAGAIDERPLKRLKHWFRRKSS